MCKLNVIYQEGLQIEVKLLHRESKKCAALTMPITLSLFLIDLQNSLAAAKIDKFPTKAVLVYPPHHGRFIRIARYICGS